MTIDTILPWLVTGFAILLAGLAFARGNGSRKIDRLQRLLEHEMQARADDTRDLQERLERIRLDLIERVMVQGQRQSADQAQARVAQAEAMRDLAQESARQLGLIRQSVQEQLHGVVERQMQTSFQRVLEQFAQMQKALGEVSAVTAQIGDIKRLFGNIKARGGWGEAQLRSLLDDVLPEGAYDANFRMGESNDIVEFAVAMPVRAGTRPRLAIDSKFPTEAYERLLNAAAANDPDGEKAARRALETQIRLEARKISEKYIQPPLTVEFAVLYLPTDGLYTEIARMPGVIDEIGRVHRVIVMGPSLMPAMLRTVHLGYVTLALEDRTEAIARLLGLTRQEMLRMDTVLDKLARQTGTLSGTIDEARRRTRVLGRRLQALDPDDDGTEADDPELLPQAKDAYAKEAYD